MSLEALDTIGKLLFGRPLRLFVAYWIWTQGDREFYQMQLINACGKDGSNARKPLSELIELGMVEAVRQDKHSRRYRRREHPLWKVISLAVEVAGENPEREPRRTFARVDSRLE
jgi:hypothetical protein